MCPSSSPTPDIKEISVDLSLSGYDLSSGGTAFADYWDKFNVATCHMLASLKQAGLANPVHFELWENILSEQYEVYDEYRKQSGAVKLEALQDLISTLPLPWVTKAAIYRQYINERRDCYEGQIDAKEIRLKYLRIEDEVVPRISLSAYQTNSKIAHQIAQSFLYAAPSLLDKSKVIEDGASSKMSLGISIIPTFRNFCLELDIKLNKEEQVLFGLYNRTSSFANESVAVNTAKLRGSKLEQWRDAEAAILRLSGKEPSSRASVLLRFDSVFPIICGPEQWTMGEFGWEGTSSHRRLRSPFGRFESTRLELEDRQRRIELGELSKFTVQLSGRVDQSFLQWVSGLSLSGTDPIPDVEILYAFPLPSGKTYNIVLKAARSYSQRPRLDLNILSAEDQEIIGCLGSHFLLPDQKRSRAIFSEFRLSDYPEHLHSFLKQPELIDDVARYAEINIRWCQSLCDQVRESKELYVRAFPVQRWIEQRFQDYDEFVELCRAELKSLPDNQSYYPAAFFRLNEVELRTFEEQVLPKLYQLCCSERARVAEEQKSEIHSERVAQGYHGPKEGYELPLQYMLMDMIINERRCYSFRERSAKKNGIDKSQVIVPDIIGRHYDKPEWFLSIAQLPERISALTASGQISRTVVIRAYDPLDGGGFKTYPVHQHKSFINNLIETNFARLRPLTERYLQSMAPTGTEPYYLKSNQLFYESLCITIGEIERKISLYNRITKRTEEVHKAEAAQLYEDLKRKGVPEAERRELNREFRERYREEIDQLDKKILGLKEKYIFLWRTYMPVNAEQHIIRPHSILDQEILRLIYSIGADGKPRLSEVLETRDHNFRRTHSEGLGGRSMYAGGEVVLARHSRLFHNLPLWSEFDELLRSNKFNRDWHLQEINNFTGHYQIRSDTLPYAANIMVPMFNAAGIETKGVQLVDRLAPGLMVRGTGVYRF